MSQLANPYRKWTKEELGCALSWHNPKRGVVLIPLFEGRVMYPACKMCIGDLAKQGRDARQEAEEQVRAYLAKEPAFKRDIKEKQPC